MKTIQDKTITEFADKINTTTWAEGSRAVNNMSDLQRFQRVRALIEEAFVIASFTPRNGDLLFTIAALPHDTDLDVMIRTATEEQETLDAAGEDTMEKHQQTETARRFK